MALLVPGKIVVVDNNPDIAMRDIINPFWNRGESVVYMQQTPSEEACPVNTRLVILDLDLDGDNIVTEGDLENVVLILRRINSKTGFYLIALWSIQNGEREDWVERIKEKYKEQTGVDICGHFLKPFGKDLQEKVTDEIAKWITENPRAGIIFEWEKLIEISKDKAGSDITGNAGIDIIIKSIAKESGNEAVPRETIMLLNRILGRNINTCDNATLAQLKKCVDAILAASSTPGDDLSLYGKFYNFNAYFGVGENEPVRTGDIFKTNITGEPDKQYAIVITPLCDFVNNRVDYIKFVYAHRVDAETFSQIAPMEPTKKFVKHLEDQKQTMPNKFYRLCFLKDSPTFENLFHLIVNFQNTGGVKFNPGETNKISGWQRVCRLDSPWVGDIMQSYASVSSRIGVPDIPEEVAKKEAERLKGNTTTTL